MTSTITNATYYHINSNANGSPYSPMQPGDVLEIGAQTNPFFHFYEAFQRTYSVTDSATGKVIQVPAIKFLSSVSNGAVTSDVLPSIAVETAKHFLMLSRELLWENVRLAEFPEAPSRQHCLWLIETKDDVERWLSAIGLTGSYVVAKVRATGQVLRVDGSQLAGDSEPLPVWYERARAYWSGQETDNPLPEVLFEGSLQVEELVDMSGRDD